MTHLLHARKCEPSQRCAALRARHSGPSQHAAAARTRNSGSPQRSAVARTWPWVFALALLLLAAAAEAHTRSTSYSSWEISGREARVRLRIAQLELTRLPWGVASPSALQPALAAYLARNLQLKADGRTCEVLAAPRALTTRRDRALFEWRVRCAHAGALQIESTLLLEAAPSHLHFARVRFAGGAAVERVLSNAERAWRLGASAAHAENAAPEKNAPRKVSGATLGAYLKLGVQHIASGYDHLAFLFALLLLAQNMRALFVIVTGFTLAHSITLALAAVGHIQPASAAVEALIGLSIALVAVENAWVLSGRDARLPRLAVATLLALTLLATLGVGAVPAPSFAGLSLFCACYFAALSRTAQPSHAHENSAGAKLPLRVAIAFGFGLVHGFGFAGFLDELALPRERLLPALLGFNAGVEVGQLAFVALCWPLLRALAPLQGGRVHRFVLEWGNAFVCALGVFWLVARAYA